MKIFKVYIKWQEIGMRIEAYTNECIIFRTKEEAIKYAREEAKKYEEYYDEPDEASEEYYRWNDSHYSWAECEIKIKEGILNLDKEIIHKIKIRDS